MAHGKSFVSVLDDILMVSLALVSAGLLAFEYSVPLSPSEIALIDRIDIAIALVFLSEFLIRFFTAPHKGNFFKMYWWELLACIPITSQTTQALRVLRLLRLIRLLRLSKGFREIFEYLEKFFKQTHVLYIIITWLLILLAGMAAFYAFEHSLNPQHPTLFDSLWWAMATITTVGYGDLYPVTFAGRIVGMFLMLAGIGTTGIFTALIASFFIRDRSK